jgi:hypothetical protein
MMPLSRAKIRFGPFPMNTTSCSVQINGKDVGCELVESGDSKWAIVEFVPTERTEIAALYACGCTLPQEFKIKENITNS